MNSEDPIGIFDSGIGGLTVASAINKFAYENVNHKKIVDKTRKQKWYSEDLFARFHIISDTGHLRH